MRYLNRIIFINSADIRYGEVKLDGNVHLIGTQGVGKSTVLRAVLFFYNADKQRLGIPKEKKGFDEFYLPHSNSYIIYEVNTEFGAFCVMTFRHFSRAAFRFIDAPYQQRWFVDEDGAVTGESPVIRSRLRGRTMTRIVDRYDQYRDIIYGNNQAVGKEFARYALLQSRRYENIPRSISNVFLNSKVDADFIKDIIIRSMDDDEPGIDLAYYRRQVSEFEQEFSDISLWYRKDRQGRVPVRLKAEEIVDRYHRLLYLDNQLRDDAGELQYAVKDARERVPLLHESLKELQANELRQRRLLDELAEKFDKEKTALTRGIAVADDRLRTTRRKRKHYDEIGIAEILLRASTEEVKKAELAERKRQKDVLTGASDDIKMKYEKLRITLQTGQQKFYEIQQWRKDELRTRKNARFEELLAERDAKKTELEERFRSSIEDTAARLAAVEGRRSDTRFKLSSLSVWHPCKEDISRSEDSLKALELEFSGIEGNIKALSAKENSMRSALEIQQHINDLKASLEKARAALSEFIAGCGVDNELCDIVEENAIRQEVAALEAALSDSRADLKAVRELHEQKGVLEVRAGVLPNKIKALRITVAEYKDKENAMVGARKVELENEYGSLTRDCERLESELKALKTEFGKQLSTLAKAAENQMNAARKECDEQIAGCDEALRVRTRELNGKLDELELQKKAELRGRGVDMEALFACENQISCLEADLREIESQRQTVFNYTRDREEYFDSEERTVAEKAALESKLDGIVSKYDARKVADGAALQRILSEISRVGGEISALEDGLRQTSDFLAANSAMLPQVEMKMSLRTCSAILEGIRNSIIERQETLGAFKQAVTGFIGLFSGNTFHFRKELSLESDYMDFASSLSEFLLNDKIEAYRQRTSERYVEILGRVSREMGDVTRHGSEIGKIIREINYDFKEKNFVGAIKSIELRSVESSDPLVQLFLSIKAFSDEHQFAFGEANLFNSAGSASGTASALTSASVSAPERVQAAERALAPERVPATERASAPLNISPIARESADVNARAVEYLRDLMVQLQRDPSRSALTLSDTFQLQFRIVENGNDTLWVEKIANVGSDGTDILVKAMVNIMLINVFKEKVSRKFGDFRIHCMMDEIGKLHPSNVRGILNFANARNILLLNSSPTTYNVAEYRHTYLLAKDSDSKTLIRPLISRKEEAVSYFRE